MDRRFVAGLVAMLLASLGGESALAQSPATRDPSAQPPVGMVPIRSINDSINDISSNPRLVPVVSNQVPISPVGTGPAATIPSAPVLNEPISMTPIDPLHQSITHGFGSGRIASLFRRPGARPTTPSSTTPVRYLPSLGATTAPPPSFTRLPPLPGPPNDAPAAPAGRPSPYAGQIPETARPQADPVVVTTSSTDLGRPAPYINQVQPAARPQSPTGDRPPSPRPRLDPSSLPTARTAEPSTIPAPKPAEPTVPAETPAVLPAIPVELPLPPPLDPPPAQATQESTASAPIVPFGAIEPAPASLPAMQSIEPAPVAPVVVNVTPPEELPDLATIVAEAKPMSPAKQPVSVPAPAPSMVDDQVRQTSLDEAALQIKDARLKRKEDYLTFSAATVGDEIITINELENAVKLQMSDYPEVRNMAPGSPQFRELMNQVAGMTLKNLIDQRLIIQEAKSKMKGKGEQLFNDFIENLWKTEELPALYHEHSVTNVHELKIKMKEKGQNYETKKDMFVKRQMAQQFLNGEIRHKVTHDMIELHEYYEAHLNEFIKPARITWREIEVSVGRYPDRATARKKADELLARLLHNESFEEIARKNSSGPTASQGGLYVDMQPGSYGISSVNDELNRIPIGQVSQVIEAPASFHIIRVDSRREKGPLRFDEVQEKIGEQVLMQNYSKAVNDFIAKLRAKTVIRTMFENTASDPEIARRKTDPAVKPAANRQ